MVDYSKWDHIDISDDDEDCHPNIDKASWIKWKKESKQLKKAEDEKKRANEEAKLKQLKEAEQKLKEQQQEQQNLKELEKLKKEKEQLELKLAKEDEMKKKHPIWSQDTICKDGFSKTIVNKKEDPLAKKPEEFRRDLTNEIENKAIEEAKSQQPDKKEIAKEELQLTDEQKKKYQDEEEARLNEFVKQMEIKAHKFASSKTYDDYIKVISENPEIICEETHQYLLLHSSDLIKNGHDELSKKYLKGACIANYCTMLGPNGVELFFARMRSPDPKYRQDFEKETIEYWHRIKQKLGEMGKIKPKQTTQE